MKHLAKSMARFSWAVSVLAAREMASLLEDEERSATAEESEKFCRKIDDLAEATVEDLDDRFKSLFEAGTRMQEEMIDLAFQAMDPKTVAKTTSRIVHRAADAMKDLVPEEPSTDAGATDAGATDAGAADAGAGQNV